MEHSKLSSSPPPLASSSTILDASSTGSRGSGTSTSTTTSTWGLTAPPPPPSPSAGDREHKAQLKRGDSGGEGGLSASASSVALEPYDSTDLPRPPPAKRQRNRQQLSCVSCHMRKQACDKVVPCSRCIKRGVAHECRIEGRSDLPLRSPVDQNGPSSAIASPTASSGGLSPSRPRPGDLSERVKVLEAALRQTSLPSAAQLAGSSGSYGISYNADYEAARALGQLGRIEIPPEPRADTRPVYTYRPLPSPGSVASLLNSTNSDTNPRLAPTRPRLPRLQDSRQSADPQVIALVAAVPPRQLADFLVSVFFSPAVQALVGHFIETRKDIFERRYHALLDWKESFESSSSSRSHAPRPPTSLSFISMVNIVLAMGLQFLPDDDIVFVSRYTSDYRVLESSLREHAKKALELSQAEEAPDLDRVETLMYQGLYYKNCGRPNTTYDVFALAIRSAQALGMNRDVTRTQRLSPYEAEIRKRLWWHLYAYDRGSNYAFGRPYLIHDNHCDVKLPANADIEQVDPLDPSPIISRPLSEYTNSTVQFFTIELARIAGEISDRLYSSRSHSYGVVLELEDKLAAFESNLPTYFRAPPAETAHHSPRVALESAMLNIHVMWTRCLLHRTYLLKKIPSPPQPDPTARSRVAAVSVSQRLVDAFRDLTASLSREQKRFFLVPFILFEAAATLAIASLQSPSTVSLVEANDGWILEAREALLRMGEDNVVASEALRCLDVLRHKLSTVVPSHARLGPIRSSGAQYSSFAHSAGPSSGFVGVHQAPTPVQSPGAVTSSYLFGSPNGAALATPNPSSLGSSSPRTGEASGDDDWWLRPQNLIWPLGLGSLEYNQLGHWTHLMQQL